jgi:hypothetical protein
MRNRGARPVLLSALAVISLLVPVLSLGPAQALSPAQAGAAGAGGSVLFGGTWPLVSVQSKTGHLGIVRLYYSLGQGFGGRHIEAVLRSGTTALISLDDPPRTGPSYASISAGRHDAEIRSFLTDVERAAVTYRLPAIYVTFEHEANSPAHRLLGTPAQFAAAYRHIHALAARARLNWNAGGRLHWALILEHMAYFPASSRPRWSLGMGFAASYWPGPDVDVVAADGYNTGLCYKSSSPDYRQPGTAMVTPASMFGPLLAFARAHGNLPVFIAEWASVPYTSVLVRPRFIRAMQAFVLSNPAIKAASYWDSHGGGNHGHGGPGSAACDFSVNSDPLSLAALAAMNSALRAAPAALLPASKPSRAAMAAQVATLMGQGATAGAAAVSGLTARRH